MARKGGHPVLDPVRSWVLWSKTRLALTVVGLLGVLIVCGQVFGSDKEPSSISTQAATDAQEASAPRGKGDDSPEYRSTSTPSTAPDAATTIDADQAREQPATTAAGWTTVWFNTTMSAKRWRDGLTVFAMPGVVSDTLEGSRSADNVSIAGPIAVEYVASKTSNTPNPSHSPGAGGSTSPGSGSASGAPSEEERPAHPMKSPPPTSTSRGGQSDDGKRTDTGRPPSSGGGATAPPTTTPSTAPPPPPSTPTGPALPPDVTGEQIAYAPRTIEGNVQLAAGQSSLTPSVQAVGRVPLSNGRTLVVSMTHSYDGWRVTMPIPDQE